VSQCFRYIVSDPPRPLTEEDIWFQIGHVYEQQKDVSLAIPHVSPCTLLMHMQYTSAKDAYMRVLDSDPHHAKVLQQLGWLHHQQSNNFQSQELAIEYLEKSVSAGKDFLCYALA
jgi:general transcriptional corepressor CYC8